MPLTKKRIAEGRLMVLWSHTLERHRLGFDEWVQEILRNDGTLRTKTLSVHP